MEGRAPASVEDARSDSLRLLLTLKNAAGPRRMFRGCVESCGARDPVVPGLLWPMATWTGLGLVSGSEAGEACLVYLGFVHDDER